MTRTGEEIEAYLRSAHAGGRGGLVYREDPVALAFAEGFRVAVPLAVRPPGSSLEHTTLLRMQLLVTPTSPRRPARRSPRRRRTGSPRTTGRVRRRQCSTAASCGTRC